METGKKRRGFRLSDLAKFAGISEDDIKAMSVEERLSLAKRYKES